MDKTDKFLKRLTGTESTRIRKAIFDILSKNTASYDIRKLKGYSDVYRVRVGSIRIIFKQLTNDIEVLDVSRRNDTTYRDY